MKRKIPSTKYWIMILMTVLVLSVVFLIQFFVGKSPQIHVVNPVIDLGQFEETSKPKKVLFEIKNVRGGVLEITEISVSCPCVEPKLGQEMLRKGQETTLSATVSPTIRPGPWKDSIFLKSNSSKGAITVLQIKADIEYRS